MDKFSWQPRKILMFGIYLNASHTQHLTYENKNVERCQHDVFLFYQICLVVVCSELFKMLMQWSLRASFDPLFIALLHGNSNRRRGAWVGWFIPLKIIIVTLLAFSVYFSCFFTFCGAQLVHAIADYKLPFIFQCISFPLNIIIFTLFLCIVCEQSVSFYLSIFFSKLMFQQN